MLSHRRRNILQRRISNYIISESNNKLTTNFMRSLSLTPRNMLTFCCCCCLEFMFCVWECAHLSTYFHPHKYFAIRTKTTVNGSRLLFDLLRTLLANMHFLHFFSFVQINRVWESRSVIQKKDSWICSC